MKLSDKLRCYRSDRPDEWAMDEFIRMAERMETDNYTHTYSDHGVIKRCTIESLKPDADGFIVIRDSFDCYRLELLVNVKKI